MKSWPSAHRLALVGGLGALIGGLWWLMFVLDGTHAGVRRLAEVAGARPDVIATAEPRLKVEDVAALPEAAWRAWATPGYLSAPHGRVIWLRVRLRNAGPEAMKGVVADTSYFSDRVEAWWREAGGGWRHAVAGDAAANTGRYMSFYDITAIPEPSTYALLGGGACLAAAMIRRKIRRRAG